MVVWRYGLECRPSKKDWLSLWLKTEKTNKTKPTLMLSKLSTTSLKIYKHVTVYSPIAVGLLAADLRLLCKRHPDGRSTTSHPQIQSEHRTTWSTFSF